MTQTKRCACAVAAAAIMVCTVGWRMLYSNTGPSLLSRSRRYNTLAQTSSAGWLGDKRLVNRGFLPAHGGLRAVNVETGSITTLKFPPKLAAFGLPNGGAGSPVSPSGKWVYVETPWSSSPRLAAVLNVGNLTAGIFQRHGLFLGWLPHDEGWVSVGPGKPSRMLETHRLDGSLMRSSALPQPATYAFGGAIGVTPASQLVLASWHVWMVDKLTIDLVPLVASAPERNFVVNLPQTSTIQAATYSKARNLIAIQVGVQSLGDLLGLIPNRERHQQQAILVFSLSGDSIRNLGTVSALLDSEGFADDFALLGWDCSGENVMYVLNGRLYGVTVP